MGLWWICVLNLLSDPQGGLVTWALPSTSSHQRTDSTWRPSRTSWWPTSNPFQAASTRACTWPSTTRPALTVMQRRLRRNQDNRRAPKNRWDAFKIMFRLLSSENCETRPLNVSFVSPAGRSDTPGFAQTSALAHRLQATLQFHVFSRIFRAYQMDVKAFFFFFPSPSLRCPQRAASFFYLIKFESSTVLFCTKTQSGPCILQKEL